MIYNLAIRYFHFNNNLIQTLSINIIGNASSAGFESISKSSFPASSKSLSPSPPYTHSSSVSHNKSPLTLSLSEVAAHCHHSHYILKKYIKIKYLT